MKKSATKVSRIIARFGVCAAMIIVAAGFDMLINIFAPFEPKPAIFTILVAMVLCQIFRDNTKWDYITAVFCTTVWGIISLIAAPFSPVTFIFVYPWISLFPRILVGLGCYPVFRALSRLFKKSKNAFLKNILPRSIGAATGVIINTTLVLTMLGLTEWGMGGTGAGEAFVAIIMGIISFNFLIEFAVALILTPLISYPVSKEYLRRQIKVSDAPIEQEIFGEAEQSEEKD